MAKVQGILGIVGFKERRRPGSRRRNYRWGHFRPTDRHPSMALLEVVFGLLVGKVMTRIRRNTQ